MDTSDIYYSDNSQLIDDNNAEWMTNTVLIQNEHVTWQEDGPEITVDYSETANDIDKTLAESDSYLTADATESEVDSSQYFSILESNCEEEEYNEIEEQKCFVKTGREETIISNMKNEIAEQFKEAETNLEDTIAGDNDVILYRMEGSDDLFAVQLADDGSGNLQKYKYRVRQNEAGQLEAIPGSIEIQDTDQNTENHEPSETETNLELKIQKPNTEPLALINEQINENPEASELENNIYNITSFEDLNPADFLVQNSYQDDEEDYQSVEGVHVTADTEENLEKSGELDKSDAFEQEDRNTSESEYEIEELDEAFQDDNEEEDINNVENTQILQKSNIDNTKFNSEVENRNVTIFKDDKHLSYLVVKTKEKENVVVRPENLRSILKPNWSNKIKQTPQKPEKITIPSVINNLKSPKELPVENNILQKPRQPRKQTIKPVERADSEIIVQPLVYSVSDNLFCPVPEKRKRAIEDGSYVVSDESDPEFSLKSLKKKNKKSGKKTKPKNVEITILDSDEEDTASSVVELSDQEKSDNNNEQLTPENDESVIKNLPEVDSNITQSTEKNSEDNTSENFPEIKVEKKNKCPHCPKNFPRLITLKKHLLIHNTRRSLRSKTNTSETELKQTINNAPKTRQLECSKCKLKFLTEMQFKRHQTVHTMKKQEKLLPIRRPDQRISLRSQRKTIDLKPNVVAAKEIFKCEYCSQHFGTKPLLILHRNSHKTFPCPNCKTTFTAKILLDSHLRKSCVTYKPRVVKKYSPKKINSKCDVCNQIFPTVKSLQIHKNVTHKPIRTVSKPLPLPNVKPPTIKVKGAHGGVPPSLKLQQALNKLNKVKT